MKRIIPVIVFVFFLMLYRSGNAQNLGFDAKKNQEWDTTSITLSMSSFGHYGSTFLDGKMVEIFRFGGLIDDPLKQETINRLNKGNQLGIAGGEYRSTWEFQDPTPRLHNKYGYYLTGEVGGLSGAFLAKDLVSFILNGNAQYVGDTAFFAPTEMVNYAYQKFGFGINQSNRLKIGLSILNFSNYGFGRIENGYLAVPDSFDQLTLVLRGSYVSRDSAMVSFFNRAGVGLGLDMEVRIPLHPSDSILDQKTPHFVVGFKNLGAYFSNKHTHSYDVRTNYTFEGFEVNNLQQFESSLFTLNNTIDSLRPIAEIGRRTELLPFELYFFMPSLSEGKRVQPIAGFRYVNRSVLRALGYIGAEWRSREGKMLISSYLTAGGFTRFQWGLSFRHDFGAVQLGLVTNNVLGWMTKEAYGKSFGISLNYKLSCGVKG
jgi:hypothetical protein